MGVCVHRYERDGIEVSKPFFSVEHSNRSKHTDLVYVYLLL